MLNTNVDTEQNIKDMLKTNESENDTNKEKSGMYEENNSIIKTTNLENTIENTEEIKIENKENKKKEIKEFTFKDEEQIISMDTVTITSGITSGNTSGNNSENNSDNEEEEKENTALRQTVNYYLNLEQSVRKSDFRAANVLKFLFSIGLTLASVEPYFFNGFKGGGCTLTFQDLEGQKCDQFLAAKLIFSGVTINLATGWNTIVPFLDALFKNPPKELKHLLPKKTWTEWSVDSVRLAFEFVLGILSGVPSGLALKKSKEIPELAHNISVALTIASNGIANTYPVVIMDNLTRDYGLYNYLFGCLCDYRSKNVKLLEKSHKKIRDEFLRRLDIVNDDLHDSSIKTKIPLLIYRFQMEDVYKNIVGQLNPNNEDYYDKFLKLMIQKNKEGKFATSPNNWWNFSTGWLDFLAKHTMGLFGAQLVISGLSPYQVDTEEVSHGIACWLEGKINNQTYMNYPCSNMTMGNSSFSLNNNNTFLNNTFWNLNVLGTILDNVKNNPTHYAISAPLFAGPSLPLMATSAFFGAYMFRNVVYQGTKNFFFETWNMITKGRAPRYLPRDFEYAPLTYDAIMGLGIYLAINSYATAKFLLSENKNHTLFALFPWLFQFLMITVYMGSSIFNAKCWGDVFIAARNNIVNTLTFLLRLPDSALRACCGQVILDDTKLVVAMRTAFEEMMEFIKKMDLNQLMISFNALTEEEREALTGSKDTINMDIYDLEEIRNQNQEVKNEEKINMEYEDENKEIENDKITIGDDDVKNVEEVKKTKQGGIWATLFSNKTTSTSDNIYDLDNKDTQNHSTKSWCLVQ